MSALVLAAGGAWALWSVTRPVEDPTTAIDHTYVEVVPGEVGSSIRLNTVAEWEPAPVGANRASGVVTTVGIAAGDEVDQGSMLYTVDLRPVSIAEGTVPAFRDVGADMRGDDVKQVQQLLADLGFYDGPVVGESGPGTAAAIRAWQKSLGMSQTGVIAAGDVIFVPSLPTRVALDPEVVRRGASLAGGEAVLSGLPEAPVFSVPVTEAQAALMPTGTRVEITSPEGGTWEGFVTDQSRDDTTGTVHARLTGADGAVICGDECAQVPVTGQATLSSLIVTTETVSGLIVPSAALVSNADGSLAVVAEDGEQIPVTVTAAARGMSVVEGVDEGTRVEVPAGDAG